MRDHPVESGIDPGFVVIQGARQRKIMGQAIDAGLSSMLKNNKDELMPLLQSFGRRSALFRAIRNVIDHPLTFDRVINTGERLFRTKEWQSQVFRDYCRLIKDNYLIPYLHGLRKAKNGKGQHEKVLSLLENWNRDTGQHPADFGLPDLFRTLRDVIKERRPKSPRLSVKEGLREISYLDFSDDFYPDLFSLSSPEYIFEKQLNLFIRAAGCCIEHYQAEKQKINALDFADLEALSHSFLTDLFESRDRHGLKRIQKRFKYILVDEFQDTNRIQWEIISMLCSDKDRDGNQVLSPGKLFVVGDKRQAIYKFRGGDVTVFEYVTEKIRRSNSGKPVQMFWQNPEINRRIEAIEEGHWVIFDWKSNDLKGKDPHLVAEENGYNLQLACYRLAVEHILNEKVDELYIYFTDGGHLLKSHWGGDLEKTFDKMLQEVRDYENNRDRWVRDLREMKRDKSNCRFCEYREDLCSGGERV